ncbi:MAG: hypothetical protein IKD04_08060 [Clostridia bacterium]|nr:hypothetical protein [Clostridia bacterium]
MAIFLGAGAVFSILSGLIEALYWPFSIIGIIGIIIGLYFGLMLYAISRVKARLANLTCNKCGNSLNNGEYASWQEISRRWQDSNSNNYAETKLYVTVEITCTCPNCGEKKTFKETLCSGKIRVTNNAIKDNLVSTQKLVDDYFNGLIHA